MGIGLGALDPGKFDRSFFGRTMDGAYTQPGLREPGVSPAQGQQFNTISREASRNLFNSVVRPSSWDSVLGIQPKAESNYRLDTGEFTAPGSVRARTGLSGIELRAPKNLQDSYNIGAFGDSKFGGQENRFEFSYEDEDPSAITKTGALGGLASDRSGVAYSQSPYKLQETRSFGEEGQQRLGNFGVGKYGDTGSIQAQLNSPGGQLQLSNQINRTLQGSGQSRFQESGSGDISNAFASKENIESTGQNEAMMARAGIAAGGKLATMGGAAALQAANMAALSNPWTFAAGLAMIPITHFGGKAAGRLAEEWDRDKRWDTQSQAGAGLEATTDIGLQGPGEVDYNRNSMAGAQASNAGYLGDVQSSINNYLSQRASARVGPEGNVNLGMYGDLKGNTITDMVEYDKEHKAEGRWNVNHMFNAAAEAETEQQSSLAGNIEAQNKALMSINAVPKDWASNNLDSNLVDNFQTYKDRFPGLYGNYQNADDFVTREYFKQNPQVQAELEQQSNIQNLAQAQSLGLDFTKEGNQDVTASGNISLSGPGNVDYNSGAIINTNQVTGQDRLPFSGAYGGRAVPSSTVDLQLQSELDATLQGAGAQAEAINDLKFKFNNTEYGASLQLNAQRFINDLEEQLPITRESQNFINSLRENPELTSLFEQGLAPETIFKASLDYDNINKTFSNKLEWDQQQNYQQAQVYDPTPGQPNSGDEVSLANIMGDVRQIDPGKLYDIGYTDVADYSTQYKLPTPLTNQSNEYLADDYNFQKELQNQMYYYTPGQSEGYNTLANEFINRRYDLQDFGDYDASGADQYMQQIQALQEGQGIDNYSYEDLQNISSLLQQERDFDLNPEDMEPRTQGQMSQEYFLPERENINPIFNYYISGGKGWYGDPRMMDPSKADTLEKYYDYGKWGVGEQVRDEFAHGYQNRAPGSPGAGSRKEHMLQARELSPNEFAQAQIEAQPEDYSWDGQRHHLQRFFTGAPDRWVNAGLISRGYASEPDKYSHSRQETHMGMPGLFGGWTMPWGRSYATNPDHFNYNTYQNQLNQEIQQYLDSYQGNSPV